MKQGYEIPQGYEPAEEAARRAGHNFEVFKRKCLNGQVPGAYKINGPGGGLWVVPEDFRMLPPPERPRTGEERGREVARRAHRGESKAALAREYGINRGTVYNLMERYPDEGSGPSRDGPEGS